MFGKHHLRKAKESLIRIKKRKAKRKANRRNKRNGRV